jgi:hypothetical protein
VNNDWLCTNGCGVVGAVLVDGKPLCWKCYLSPEDYRLKFEAKGIVYRMPGERRLKDESSKMSQVQKEALANYGQLSLYQRLFSAHLL